MESFKQDFLHQCLETQGVWHHVFPGAAASEEQIKNSPNEAAGVYFGYDTHPELLHPGMSADNAKDWVDLSDWTPPLYTHNPVIRYGQGKASTCFYSSVASAFAYFGDTEVTKTIHQLWYKKQPHK